MANDPHDLILLDGATGTELSRRGVDISLPLWSARALLDDDRSAILEQVHREYLEAGAEAITTCTFRTHRRSLAKAGLGDRWRELTLRAVEIAQRARDKVNSNARVFGSVAPLEDCYQPELMPSPDECLAEHAAMIGDLVDGGVDMILIETMNNLREAEAAARAARERAPGRFILSFCTRSDGPPGILLSGEPMVDLVPLMSEAFAAGVNCIGPGSVHRQVALLRGLLPAQVRIIAYANVGEPNPGDGSKWIDTDAADPVKYAECAMQWRDAGASILGGCCGTTPEHVRALANTLRSN